MMEPNVWFFSFQLDLAPIFTVIFRPRFRHTIASNFQQKPFQRLLFCFEEIWLSDWLRFFLHQYQKNMPACFFCRTSAGATVFRWKKAAVNLNSQQKFYDNDSSAILRRLTVVSIGKKMANLKKIPNQDIE